MDTSCFFGSLDKQIICLSAIENAVNIYRRNGSMDALYDLQQDDYTRPILQKWLAYASMPELDSALNAMDQKTVHVAALSPYNDIMLHCQTEWDRPVECIHIVYVHNGTFTCTIADESLTLKPGWCYIFHVNIAKTIYPDTPDARLLNCLISQNYFENILMKRFDRTAFFANFLTQSFYTVNSSVPLLQLDTTGNAVVRSAFCAAIVEQVEQQPLYESAVNNMVCTLMVELLRTYMQDSDSQHYHELGNNKLSDILNYISQNCATATLATVAQEYHFNPCYLSRIIKRNTGQTFTEILQTTRLKKAVTLLVTTEMPISAITNYVGYHNCTHFYRLFQSIYGMSPAQYRQERRHQSHNT